MPSEQPRITVVNDNPEFLQLMQDLLQDATYPTTLIDGDRDNAVELIEASKPDLLILDLRMQGEELRGLDVLRELRVRPSLRDVRTIVCTAASWELESVWEEVRKLDRVTLLTKPFSVSDLHAAIEETLKL